MKKLLALLMVLMLALPMTALADDSTQYFFSIMDPILYQNDEIALDMSGLNLELSAMLTDSDLFALIFSIFVGENYETSALSAQLQLDDSELIGYINGMSNAYKLDIASLYGDDTAMLPSVSDFRETFESIDLSALNIDLSFAARTELISAFAAPYVTETKSIDGGLEHTFVITREQGAAFVTALCDALAALAEEMETLDMDVDLNADDLKNVSFDLSGTLTAMGDLTSADASLAIEASGTMYSDDEGNQDTVALSVSCYDSYYSTSANIKLTTPEDYAVGLTLESTTTPTDDDREYVSTDILFTVNNEVQQSYSFTSDPIEGSPRVDNTLVVSNFASGDELIVVYSTDDYDETTSNEGWTFYLIVGESDFFVAYEGNAVNDENGDYHVGALALSTATEGTSYSLNTYLALGSMPNSSSSYDWMLDSAEAIDIISMDDAALSSAQMGLIGAIANAATAISENVPGLAEIVNALINAAA